MRSFFIFPLIVMFIVVSCRDNSIQRYYGVIDRADSIVISSTEYPDSVVVSTIPGIDTMKENLKRHIEPGGTQKFFPERWISFYERGKTIGVMMISAGENPIVNFRGDGLNLTFAATTGIKTHGFYGVKTTNTGFGNSSF